MARGSNLKYVDPEYRQERARQGQYIRQLKQDPQAVLQYAFSKKRYDIKTYTVEELRKRGATQEEIGAYFTREIQLYTGDYEMYRNQVFIDNYINSMEKRNISNETIKEILNLFEDRTIKEQRYIASLLTPINVHYRVDEDDLENDIKADISMIKALLGIED